MSCMSWLRVCIRRQLSNRGSAGCKVLEQGVTCLMQIFQGHTLEKRDIVRGWEAARSRLQARVPSKRLKSCPKCALRDTALSGSIFPCNMTISISDDSVSVFLRMFRYLQHSNTKVALSLLCRLTRAVRLM